MPWNPSEHFRGGDYAFEGITNAAQTINQDPQKGEDPTVIDPYVDPVNGNPVEGIGIVRKTGAVVHTKAGGIEQDPQTGMWGVRDSKGEFKPIDPTKVLEGQKMKAAAAANDPN